MSDISIVRSALSRSPSDERHIKILSLPPSKPSPFRCSLMPLRAIGSWISLFGVRFHPRNKKLPFRCAYLGGFCILPWRSSPTGIAHLMYGLFSVQLCFLWLWMYGCHAFKKDDWMLLGNRD